MSLIRILLAFLSASLVACRENQTVRSSSDLLLTSRLGGLEGRHTIQNRGGRYWIANPLGKVSFSLGVCCVNQGVLPDQFQLQNPAYSAARLFPNQEAWVGTVLQQLNDWKITNLGGWADWEVLRQSASLNQTVTPVLHLGSSASFPWEDMWDPERIEYLQTLAKRLMAPYRDDSRVIGYYSDNELGWWNGALFRYTLEHPPSSRQRQLLVEQLEERYAGNWSQLERDFIPMNANGFGELRLGGSVTLRPGSNGIGAYRAFLSSLSRRYYELMSDAIRSVDSRALFLGDRYQSFYYREVVESAAPFVDVISTNLKPAWLDGGQLKFYMKTLNELSRKPILVGEVYMAAMENQTGNLNSVGGFPTVPTQSERAASATRLLVNLAREPAVIGVDWFQYYDEPPRGRFDGEDYNMGLVGVHGQPYSALVNAIGSLDLTRIHRESIDSEFDQFIPRAPSEPFVSILPWQALQNWDRERGFIQPSSPASLADFYACWEPDMLFLGVYALNHEEREYYVDGMVPVEDRSKLEVFFPNSGLSITKILGIEPSLSLRGQKVGGGLIHHELIYPTRSVMVLGISRQLLQSVPLGPGSEVSMEAVLVGHGGSHLASWTETLTCAESSDL